MKEDGKKLSKTNKELTGRWLMYFLLREAFKSNKKKRKSKLISSHFFFCNQNLFRNLEINIFYHPHWVLASGGKGHVMCQGHDKIEELDLIISVRWELEIVGNRSLFTILAQAWISSVSVRTITSEYLSLRKFISDVFLAKSSCVLLNFPRVIRRYHLVMMCLSSLAKWR